ncbi:hypothetical protein GGH96_002251 [Coemansia sp. RSA 1972]|nr:hypothetical protein GGH96_002251 [Coemansia sp. RSA 1972]
MNPLEQTGRYTDARSLSTSTTVNSSWPQTAFRESPETPTNMQRLLGSGFGDLVHSMSEGKFKQRASGELDQPVLNCMRALIINGAANIMHANIVQRHGPPVDLTLRSLRTVDLLQRETAKPGTQANSGTQAGLDEEQLWRLYSKSEALLPNGTRVRNILWRMNNQHRTGHKKSAESERSTMINWDTAGHGLTRGPVECQKPAAGSSDLFGGAGPATAQGADLDLASCGFPPLPTPQTAGSDRDRRRLSHTAVGAEAGQMTSLGTSALPPHQEAVTQGRHATDMDIDLELARPLEFWNMPLDASLLWLANSSRSAGNGMWPLQRTTDGADEQLPRAAGVNVRQSANEIGELPLMAQQSQHVALFDTQLIDARASASAHADSAESANALGSAERQPRLGTAAADLDLFLSPNSLLPHWPHEAQATAAHKVTSAASAAYTVASAASAADGSKGKHSYT